jgi:acetyltransferase AlgX (SGNH hydrolase-like protein)
MKNKILIAVIFALTYTVNADFSKTCNDALKTISENSITYKGQDGWLFTAAELRHLSVGKFWGKDASKASRCSRPDRADPVPAIVDFDIQLKKIGIKLIMVPVPPKATIYPEGMAVNIKPKQTSKVLKEFYKSLRSKGVDVLDLSEAFMKLKNNKKMLYCQQDSHWNGYGCEIAAKQISRKIKAMLWYKTIKKIKYSATNREIKIEGDLWKSLNDKSLPKEKLSLRFISGKTVSASSPVLLMGDSHTLIFHAGGDMLAEKAGLIDQLAFDLKVPVNLLAVRGSGATTVRINLYRKAKKKNWLKNIKVIIWCFTARDFTEATSGWRKIPVKKL